MWWLLHARSLRCVNKKKPREREREREREPPETLVTPLGKDLSWDLLAPKNYRMQPLCNSYRQLLLSLVLHPPLPRDHHLLCCISKWKKAFWSVSAFARCTSFNGQGGWCRRQFSVQRWLNRRRIREAWRWSYSPPLFCRGSTKLASDSTVARLRAFHGPPLIVSRFTALCIGRRLQTHPKCPLKLFIVVVPHRQNQIVSGIYPGFLAIQNTGGGGGGCWDKLPWNFLSFCIGLLLSTNNRLTYNPENLFSSYISFTLPPVVIHTISKPSARTPAISYIDRHALNAVTPIP